MNFHICLQHPLHLPSIKRNQFHVLFLKVSTYTKCGRVNSISKSSQASYKSLWSTKLKTVQQTSKSSVLIITRLVFLNEKDILGSYLDFFFCFLTRGIMSCLNSSTTLFKDNIDHETNKKQNKNVTSLTFAMFFTHKRKTRTNISHGAFRHLEAN